MTDNVPSHAEAQLTLQYNWAGNWAVQAVSIIAVHPQPADTAMHLSTFHFVYRQAQTAQCGVHIVVTFALK